MHGHVYILSAAVLELTREQIVAFRRHVGALDERLPPGARSLRQAAWAGLQDSMPRAALLSIHARVEGAHPAIWADKSLVQVEERGGEAHGGELGLGGDDGGRVWSTW